MRITLSSALVAVTTTLAGTAATAPSANAYDMSCWYGVGSPVRWQTPITGNLDIPVYINISDTHGIQWSGYDNYDLIMSVWVAIGRWNEQSGTRVRLRYAGTVDYGELDQIGPIPRGVYVYGNYPTDPGGQVWCTDLLGAALPLDPNDDNIIDYAWVAIPGANGSCTPRTLDPERLTEILTHEFGHALGRNDAYLNACGQNHTTLMAQDRPDLSLFDTLELQNVYGRRTTGSTLRRVLNVSGGAWATQTTLESTPRMTRPGPAASVRTGPLQMAWRETTTAGVMRMVRRMVSTSSPIGAATTENVNAESPISIAHAPDGTTVMAYVKASTSVGIMSSVCWRISTNNGSTYGGETCGASATFNGVAIAYDPLSAMFALGYTNSAGEIELKSIGTSQSIWPERTTSVPGAMGAEGVAIACANTSVRFNQNCRVVYAAADEYRQPIEWFPVSIGFSGFGIGAATTTTLYSQHVPAVAWFHDRFHLAFSYVDRYIYHYDMPRTGTAWTYRAMPAPGSAATAWLSPPHLAPITECNGDICATRLQLIWLQYQ